MKQVKVWCTKQEASVLNIDMKANICCVKYNPGSSIYVAVNFHPYLCCNHVDEWSIQYDWRSGSEFIFTDQDYFILNSYINIIPGPEPRSDHKNLKHGS